MSLPQSSQMKRQLFDRLNLLAGALLLVSLLPETVTSLQSHRSARTRLPTSMMTEKVPSASNRRFLKLSASLTNQDEDSAKTSNIMDYSEILPCLDQWVTLPSGEIMGIIYLSNAPSAYKREEFTTMNDGDIVATSTLSQDDLPSLQEGMNVATSAGTQYTLLNRASVEMAQHYNALLETNDPTAEDMPPIPTAGAASFITTPSLMATSTAPPFTIDTPEIQEDDMVKALLQQVKDVALSTVAWFQVNLVDRFVSPISDRVQQQQQQPDSDAMRAMEEYRQYLHTRSPELRRKLEHEEEELSGMCGFEEYQQYRSNRSPELQQQYQQFQQPNGEELLAEPSAAMEEYLEYRQQRSPELQQQFQQFQQPPVIESTSPVGGGMSAMEEYEQYKQQRSPELQQHFQQYEEEEQPPAESSSSAELSAMEEYQQYQDQRSPELQQQFQQYQPPESSSSADELNDARKEYEQYQQQRSPELQQQYENYQQGEQSQASSTSVKPQEPLTPEPSSETNTPPQTLLPSTTPAPVVAT